MCKLFHSRGVFRIFDSCVLVYRVFFTNQTRGRNEEKSGRDLKKSRQLNARACANMGIAIAILAYRADGGRYYD